MNFLGALTSDVDFGDQGNRPYARTTDNTDTGTYQQTANGQLYGTASFYDWKAQFPHDRWRNNGNSHNKVALASGVYLELTSEKSTGTDLYEKDWGLITGVVELDLINVQPGMGGGYVYAKNEHGIRSTTGKDQVILTALNRGAVTNKHFQYTTDDGTKKEWETSGNFVHSTQTIIDDCYNVGGKYLTGYNKPNGVPAHYWFIKGAVYIYDQYISAYTGSPNAYSEIVNIPLTITSASHGKMTLLNVQPNFYAYYADGSLKPLEENEKIELRETEYGRNDAINYWDYSTLAQNEKNLFVSETYVVTADCVYGPEGSEVTYTAGTVLLPGKADGSEEGTYNYLKKHAPTKKLEEDDVAETPYVHHVVKDKDVDFDFVFRPSNNVSHDTGYILTYTVDNPNQWNTWYTPKNGTSLTGKKNSEEIVSVTRDDYENGPTYRLKDDIEGGMVLGQNEYHEGDVISEATYYTYEGKDGDSTYPGIKSHITSSNGSQAKFYPAWIVTADVLETEKDAVAPSVPQRFHKGATLAKENYAAGTWSSMLSSVAPAFVVTRTIQLSKTEFIYRGTYMTEAEKTTLYNKYKDGTDAEKKLAKEIDENIVEAYYCTKGGNYGGDYYVAGRNYRGLAAFSDMSESDRKQFTFNYDALDLLIDPKYRNADGVKYQYDGDYNSTDEVKDEEKGNKATYSLPSPIDYTATYNNADKDLELASNITVKRPGSAEPVTTDIIQKGDTLSRDVFESLPNERQHYSAITVSDVSKTYYVVTQTVVMGDTPYAAGQFISSDTYKDLNDADKAKVKKLTFTNTGDYYYCHEGYTINTSLYSDANKGKVTAATGVTVDGSTLSGTYDSTVPVGTVINKDNYKKLVNQQANFAIHGVAPTETSTLYVTRNSDIFDLSAEKIITVIYKYDYLESDMDGMHITPVSEYHVLNIHLNFKSGVPTVEDIKAPDIILSGTNISMPEPYVTPGAYEITGSGWELFDTETDAESHINGVEYAPVSDPLYLYQNKHFLAYYAKTYLGKTYSNHVPVSVANYHDLKKVMEATDHHYYIDHKEIFNRLNVEPKIYINNYSGEKDGLDMFKDLYDLSVLESPTVDPSTGLITDEGTFKDHKPLNSRVKAGKGLQFFLRTDIERGTQEVANPEHATNPEAPETITVTKPWTPIASGSDPCFEGTLHGDGHTISGLDNSLFGKLCGNVYNLGVTGSFTSAGVADSGDGYVESCWVKTTGTTPLGTKPYPIFGDPSRGTGIQLVNSYYSDANKNLYNTGNNSRGTAIQMPDDAFYNGEVAYDLNNFYLYKRYSDHTTALSGSPVEYKYWKQGATELELQTGKYYNNSDDDAKECSSGGGYTYVEDRFADGDFRYAGGTIPEEEDERRHDETVEKDGKTVTEFHFYPIYPDDYIFFGQRLNYGYSATYPHNDTPTAIARANGRLSQNLDANRVYRAPAYYRSNVMNVAHFNPHAYLAAMSKDGTKEAHPNMTAIDFADHKFGSYNTYKTYGLGTVNGTADGLPDMFYPPLLDDDGLLSIVNIDETQNLLVYAPASSGKGYVNSATHDVLTSYFADPAYADYYDNDDGYRLVADASAVTSSIYGHLVQSDLTATNDHLLVDKQDFNAPIAYDFDADHRMWYQRIPEDQEYVDFTKGWQGISLPFTAELVTTNQKGEITHFYSGSETSKNGTSTKVGHEYWLRRLDNIKEEGTAPDIVAKADFFYPIAGKENKTVTNRFLWDYYYYHNHNEDVHNQKDANADIYLQYRQYYNENRTYAGYPLVTAATPYILGLPGETYYEFDLSGKFEAMNTAEPIDKLGKQIITFASEPNASIKVSDVEINEIRSTVTKSGYTFMPSYLNMSLDAGTNNYTLAEDGSKYEKVPATGEATTVSAFRPFFTVASSSVKKQLPSYILFSGEYGSPEEGPESVIDGGIEIYARGRTIYTRSHLQEPAVIRIINIGGGTITSYVLEPEQTVTTQIHVAGAYLVNRKKLFIR